jgi:AGCS family alanine or glycine:cation symporter
MDKMIVGWICMIIVGLIIIGGIKRIGNAASIVASFMILIYCFFGTIVLITNASAIPSAFALVFHDAFTETAAVGGFWGSTASLAIHAGHPRKVCLAVYSPTSLA